MARRVRVSLPGDIDLKWRADHFSGVPLTEVDVVFLTLPSDQPYDPSLDEELTKQAAAKSEQSRKIKIASATGKKNWGWNLWEAEVALDDLHKMMGGETRGQIVAVAKASTSFQEPSSARKCADCLNDLLLHCCECFGSLIQSTRTGTSRLAGLTGICGESDSTDGASRWWRHSCLVAEWRMGLVRL